MLKSTISNTALDLSSMFGMVQFNASKVIRMTNPGQDKLGVSDYLTQAALTETWLFYDESGNESAGRSHRARGFPIRPFVSLFSCLRESFHAALISWSISASSQPVGG